MRSIEEIIAYLARRIGYIYHHRPLMYGGTGAGVDQLLLTYHEVWAEAVDRHEEFMSVSGKVMQEEECGAASFSMRYAMNNPGASENEIALYVVDQWRKVSDRLGVPVPHSELKRLFSEDSTQ
jgi:hypothetical protein